MTCSWLIVFSVVLLRSFEISSLRFLHCEKKNSKSLLPLRIIKLFKKIIFEITEILTIMIFFIMLKRSVDRDSRILIVLRIIDLLCVFEFNVSLNFSIEIS